MATRHLDTTTNNRMLFITERIGGDVTLFIAYKWRHSDVIIIKLPAFIQNEILYKTYISNILYLENNRIYAGLP